MACDPNTLLEQAKCVLYCIPRGNRKPVIVSLLCQIMQQGLGGATFRILTESGNFLTAETGDRLRKE